MKNNYLFFYLILLIFQFGIQSCVPVFSELQSARLVGKKRVELTPLFSTVSTTDGTDKAHVENELGLQVIVGLSNKIDFRMRSELIWIQGDDYSDLAAIVGFGPKISLIKNKIALSLPFGTIINSDFMNEWEFQPTMLLTLPAVPDKLDITLSPKYIIPFCEDCGSLAAVNIGLAISSDLSKWAVRPEYGQLYDFGEKGHAAQFSIGLSKTFGK